MTKVVVMICFAMAFAAGLMVGRQTRPVVVGPESSNPSAATRPSGGRHWSLVRELNLDPNQQKQLEKIWSETARMGGREREDRRRQLRRERDEAIASLVPPEHYGKYDQILKHYFEKTEAIDQEMKAAFDEAVRQTKEILTPEQRAKYEQLLKRHQPPQDRDGRGPKDKDREKDKGGSRDQSGRRGDDPTRATPRPATAPDAEVAPL
jgi:Spy/CpxP family protein refolding chaperone